jgi:hypothetical protein
MREAIPPPLVHPHGMAFIKPLDNLIFIGAYLSECDIS